jgi:hypothetical protein
VRKWILRIAHGGLVLLALVQLVPFGRDHTNPPVTKEVAWDSVRTRELAVGACTTATATERRGRGTERRPAFMVVYADVKGGRETLNFSEWDSRRART